MLSPEFGMVGTHGVMNFISNNQIYSIALTGVWFPSSEITFIFCFSISTFSSSKYCHTIMHIDELRELAPFIGYALGVRLVYIAYPSGVRIITLVFIVHQQHYRAVDPKEGPSAARWQCPVHGYQFRPPRSWVLVQSLPAVELVRFAAGFRYRLDG